MYGGDTEKEKIVFLHLEWGGRRRYGGVGRKSASSPIGFFGHPK